MKHQPAGQTSEIPTSTPASKLLKVVAIFRTLDGECTLNGPLQFSTFIRLGGCNLRCWKSTGFCDAPATLDMSFPYPEMTVEQIITKVEQLKVKRVTITGGEPLLQKPLLLDLCYALKELGIKIHLETSGSIALLSTELYAFDCVIMDLKPPSTEMEKMNKFSMIPMLRTHDYIKFVLSDRADFTWALSVLKKYNHRCHVAMGPRFGYLTGAEIVKWLAEAEQFQIQLNLQLHKYIWPHDEPYFKDLKQVDFNKFVALEK